MATLTIEGRDYDLEKLNEAARQQLQNITIVDQEIRRQSAQLAIFQTARNAYLTALRMALPKD